MSVAGSRSPAQRSTRSGRSVRSDVSSAIEWSPPKGGSRSVVAGSEDEGKVGENHLKKEEHEKKKRKKGKRAAGELRSSDVRELKELFRMWSSDDTILTFNETKALLNSLGQTPSDHELTLEIAKCKHGKKADKSTDINFDQLQKLIQPRFVHKHSESDIINAFKVLDRDNTGCVPIEDLSRALATVGTADSKEAGVTKFLLSLLKPEEFNDEDELLYRDFIDRIMKA